MSGLISKLFLGVSFVAACVYLTQIDYSSKLETDVSSLLPQVETEEARLARKLISEEQGRAVYLEIDGLPEIEEDTNALELVALNLLKSSPLVESIVRIDQNANLEAFKVVAEHRLELLFPKWMSEKRLLFENEGDETADFFVWAAASAVEDMDVFLESPSAMELTEAELIDPLLLNISNLLALSENESGSFVPISSAKGERARYYWLTLAASPLSPRTQEDLDALINDSEQTLVEGAPDLKLSYGGLVRLAGASRERIQGDILKINFLSLLGVTVVAFVFLRKPWQLLLTVPTLVAAAIGAMTFLFLVFHQVNIIVLVVGSILIGTSIDYAIHLIFAEHVGDDFPTKKLIRYACLSTVAGFLVLLFAELALIRQIGVFVGAGLLCAYLTASVFIRPGLKERKMALRMMKQKKGGGFLTILLAVVVVFVGGFGLLKLQWRDDVRNLESPDTELVQKDLELRERMGSTESSRLFLTTDHSYLDVFESEARLMGFIKKRFPESSGFGVSEFLPTRSQVSVVEEMEASLGRFFDVLKVAFEEGGYASEEFGDFFTSATSYVESLKGENEIYRTNIQEFADRLAGPMAGIIGEFDGRYWSLSSIDLSSEEALAISDSQENATLFSQLSFLNKTLNNHREALLFFGAFSMLLVVGTIVIVFGWRKGGLIVIYPIMGGGVAVGLCSFIFGDLNMFHLVGCFLGGAISLDYALFSIESFSRNDRIPHSVWLSAGTTSASFLALGFSSIPVVQSLGSMVVLLACITLLLLYVSSTYLSKNLNE